MSIIGICWATLGLLAGLGGIAFYFVPLPAASPALIAMKKELWYILMLFGLGAIGLILDLLLLFGSVWSLKLEKAGQRLLTLYACGKVVVSVIAFTLSFTLVLPLTMAAAVPLGKPMPPGFEAAMQVGMYAGACTGLAFAFAMPVYVLITLRLRKVRDAYDGLFDATGSFEVNTPPLQG
ncbi:MAG TPA: hypothetical protein VM008_12050 [Phycisphaerae bacterium]|nr:hypothetical protein [Phycisphaerae bacterium]